MSELVEQVLDVCFTDGAYTAPFTRIEAVWEKNFVYSFLFSKSS